MPHTNVLGTTAPPGSGAQQCAQAGEREHRIDNTICHQCGKPLPATARRHARFCSPAHRRAAYRAHTPDPRRGRARFLAGIDAKNPAAVPYAIGPDERFPGMCRLKRADGSFSDMLNLTRARDALAQSRRRP
jgi:hypothetical protein